LKPIPISEQLRTFENLLPFGLVKEINKYRNQRPMPKTDWPRKCNSGLVTFQMEAGGAA